MAVHYKFKNTINYDAVKFDGVYISAADLKTTIIKQKKLGHSELQLVNEETAQVYTDEQMIAKNTNIIVSRLPPNKRASRQMSSNHPHNSNSNNNNHNHNHNHNNGNNNNIFRTSNPSSSQHSSEALEIVSTKDMTEEEKIKQIQHQSTKGFELSNYARGGRGGHHQRGRGGRPGHNYVCRKCGISGHYINDCKISHVPKVKRASGIPKDFLMKVDPKEKGALMTPSGEYAVPILDREAYSNPKVERAPFFEDGIMEESQEHQSSEPTASASSASLNRENRHDVKPKIEDLNNAMVRYEQGTKRDLELVGSRESDLEKQVKKAKLGFAIPNWKNISKSTQPDADRYAQYHLVQLRSQCESLVASRERSLLSKPLYTISTNVLCRQTKNDKDIYIPIEIGIYSYSIEKGQLGRQYHVIIDSGPIPPGLVNKTRDHTEATHKISNPSKGKYPPEARNDYLSIYKELLKYTKGGERTVLVPFEHDMTQVKGCLEWLYEKAAFLDPSVAKITTWTILPMVEYVAAAYNFVVERMLHRDPIFTIHYVLKQKQEDSTWDYDDTLMCSYHKREENQTQWCARNCATRGLLVIERILNDLYKDYKRATEGGGMGAPQQNLPTAPQALGPVMNQINT